MCACVRVYSEVFVCVWLCVCVLGFAAERYVLLCARARRIARARRNTVCVCARLCCGLSLMNAREHACMRGLPAKSRASMRGLPKVPHTHEDALTKTHSLRLCHLMEME